MGTNGYTALAEQGCERLPGLALVLYSMVEGSKKEDSKQKILEYIKSVVAPKLE